MKRRSSRKLEGLMGPGQGELETEQTFQLEAWTPYRSLASLAAH